jgi:hypothetical protein
MSFTFTSPNAAGAGAQEKTIMALRETMETLQNIDSELIEQTTEFASIQQEATINAGKQQAEQAKFDAIGGFISAGTAIGGAVTSGISSANTTKSIDFAKEVDANTNLATEVEASGSVTHPDGGTFEAYDGEHAISADDSASLTDRQRLAKERITNHQDYRRERATNLQRARADDVYTNHDGVEESTSEQRTGIHNEAKELAISDRRVAAEEYRSNARKAQIETEFQLRQVAMQKRILSKSKQTKMPELKLQKSPLSSRHRRSKQSRAVKMPQPNPLQRSHKHRRESTNHADKRAATLTVDHHLRSPGPEHSGSFF